MKRIKSLVKLSNVNAEKLSEKDQSGISGGNSCFCGCYYETCYGSSTANNAIANARYGWISLPPIGKAEWGYWY